MDKTTTSTTYNTTWTTRWSSGTGGDRISISSESAASSCRYILIVCCTALRSFPRQTFWRTNTVSSTSKTKTRNASFGACCRRYIHPPHHPYRLSNYKDSEHSLNVEGLTFPVQTKQIPFSKNSTPPYPSTFWPSKRVAKGSRWNIAASNANENTT